MIGCLYDHEAIGSLAAAAGESSIRCGICGLPIGVPCEPQPANDTPDALVELRAAELADVAASNATAMESWGWFGWSRDSAPVYFGGTTDQWSAGWLGRCINEHDKEQR